MAVSKEAAFYEYLRDRYKGKIYKIERLTNPAYDTMIVRVEFHIPADDADEMEMYRRINKVIEVIAEGDDG
jgi:hypothetical protein